MIIKKLETYIILIKPKKDDIFEQVKSEILLKPGFENIRIVEMEVLDKDDSILGNKDYMLQYKEYEAVKVTVLKLI